MHFGATANAEAGKPLNLWRSLHSRKWQTNGATFGRHKGQHPAKSTKRTKRTNRTKCKPADSSKSCFHFPFDGLLVFSFSIFPFPFPTPLPLAWPIPRRTWPQPSNARTFANAKPTMAARNKRQGKKQSPSITGQPLAVKLSAANFAGS